MKASGCLAWGVVVALAVPVSACAADNKLPAAAQVVLDKAEQFELLSLDPKPVPKADQDKEKNVFHGYRVLGKTTVKDATRNTLLAALDKGIKDADPNLAAGCFNPRHGIRATHDGKTVDLVICFECLAIVVYVDDKSERGPHVTGSPQEAFDKVLKAANVPLSPKPGDK
ncbi:MAG TPA: hypothetical protein VKE74_25315 [Gemmataceae bacterium]|nr:hypothetical protein [Gemmataceae bacterium]